MAISISSLLGISNIKQEDSFSEWTDDQTLVSSDSVLEGFSDIESDLRKSKERKRHYDLDRKQEKNSDFDKKPKKSSDLDRKLKKSRDLNGKKTLACDESINSDFIIMDTADKAVVEPEKKVPDVERVGCVPLNGDLSLQARKISESSFCGIKDYAITTGKMSTAERVDLSTVYPIKHFNLVGISKDRYVCSKVTENGYQLEVPKPSRYSKTAYRVDLNADKKLSFDARVNNKLHCCDYLFSELNQKNIKFDFYATNVTASYLCMAMGIKYQQDRQLSTYKVWYRNKYYVFHFKGSRMSHFYEKSHDSY